MFGQEVFFINGTHSIVKDKLQLIVIMVEHPLGMIILIKKQKLI